MSIGSTACESGCVGLDYCPNVSDQTTTRSSAAKTRDSLPAVVCIRFVEPGRYAGVAWERSGGWHRGEGRWGLKRVGVRAAGRRSWRAYANRKRQAALAECGGRSTTGLSCFAGSVGWLSVKMSLTRRGRVQQPLPLKSGGDTQDLFSALRRPIQS
jgi:hypothetical protein